MSRRFTVDRAYNLVSILSSRNEYSVGHFEREHIHNSPDLQADLKALNRVFTDYFGIYGEYRNLRDIIVLACAMRLSAVRMEAKPMAWQLSLNTIGLTRHLHHDPTYTPIVVSQFPYAPRDELYFSKDYYDLVVNNTAVEVGDCRVSKVLEALKKGLNLWVLPEPMDTIYIFTKGRKWRSLERLENRIFDALQKALEELDRKTVVDNDLGMH